MVNAAMSGGAARFDEKETMKYLFINASAGVGSTGRIVAETCRKLQVQGHTCVAAYGRSCANCDDIKTVRIGTPWEYRWHGVLTRLFDLHGFGSKRATKEFLHGVKDYDPDVIWLHNIHGYYINVELLFDYLKTCGKTIKWTLHDCWAFTGHCSYFSAVRCEQWKDHCSHCRQLRRYPKCYAMSNVSKNFVRKRAAFTGVPNMTLVVPSHWLEGLVRQSFLKEYPVEVVYNTIDTDVFKPTPSDFREKYGLQDKIIVLGVANVWEERKGLDDFIKLAQMLDDRYAIVLVGLTEKQIKQMPQKIKGIKRTNSAKEMAAIYSAADVFVNSSMEETYGTTTVEAQVCGTKTIVYEDTACEEVGKETGSVVIPADVDVLFKVLTERNRGIHNTACRLICIPRTQNAKELAGLYTTADYFVNPTYEDNFPTVNLEAQACGTPVISYDVGGCAETLETFSKDLTRSQHNQV